MHIAIDIVPFSLQKPFAITGHVFEASETVRVTLEDRGHKGRGEAVGVYYELETPDTIVEQLEAVIPDVEAGVTLQTLQSLLPPGGARNALDCALWDLRAKSAGKTVWNLLSLTPKEITTVFTLGIAEPELMAERAREASRFPHLKIKLDNDHPIESLEAIRTARPDAELVIDVNQGWSLKELMEYLPHCERLGIAMIEQPLPRGDDEGLTAFKSPVPLGADESCLHLGEFDDVAERYDVLNIKLDKCGGLSEGLALVRAAQSRKMGLMIGNMVGSSLSMAPSYVIGQYCRFVDIDGPLHLTKDVAHGLAYLDGGRVGLPDPALWG